MPSLAPESNRYIQLYTIQTLAPGKFETQRHFCLSTLTNSSKFNLSNNSAVGI